MARDCGEKSGENECQGHCPWCPQGMGHAYFDEQSPGEFNDVCEAKDMSIPIGCTCSLCGNRHDFRDLRD
jgi:hypothetical protein